MIARSVQEANDPIRSIDMRFKLRCELAVNQRNKYDRQIEPHSYPLGLVCRQRMIALKPVHVSMPDPHGDSVDDYEGVGTNVTEDTTTAIAACTPPITEEISGQSLT